MYRKLAAALLSSVVLVFVALSGTAQTNPKQASDAAGSARGTVRTIQSQIAAATASPFSVAAGPENRVYFAVSRAASEAAAAAGSTDMSNRIFSVVPGQRATHFAGTGSFGYLGDGGLAADAEFELSSIMLGNADSSQGTSSAPALALAPPHSGIVVAADGTLFVADTQNSTIRTIAGPETSEPMITRSLLGKWAGPSNIELIAPTALAMDASGNLYIADIASNSILAYRDNTIVMLAHVISPGAIAVNATGTKLYVASLAAGKVFEIDSSSTNRLPNGSSIRTLLASAAPSGLAVDGAGNIFVADSSANTIRRLDIQSGALSVVAGTGTAGYSGDGGSALLAAFRSPADLVFDRGGDLFVSDAGNHAIRELPDVGQPEQATTVTLGPASAGQFGNVVTGGSSSAQAFTLTNGSGVALTSLVVTIAGADPLDFSQTNTCGSALAVSATCNINVIFNPTNVAARSATLQVTDSDPSSPQTAALTGFGDDFEISAQTRALTTMTIRQGTTGTFNLAAAPDQTFTGTVNLQCPANLPTSTTCVVNPTTVTWPSAPGASQNFTAAFTTTKKTTTSSFAHPSRFPSRPVGLVALGLLTLIWVAARIAEKRSPISRSFGRARTRQLAFALAALVLLVAGCGNSTTISTAPDPTPTGTYTLTVSGEAQNASRGVTLTLVVEAAP